MILNRFHCKTNIQGITTIFVVVVMPLLLITACGGDVKEVVDVKFDPETSFTLKTTDVSTLVSDSGITRYRIKAKVWLMFDKAKEPYSYFPEGFYTEKFDTLFRAEASVKADTAYNYQKKRLWKLIGNVKVKSLEGKKLETSLLFWDEAQEKIYSDQYVRIEDGEKIVTGYGFDAKQDMSEYEIYNSGAAFPINEAPADSALLSLPDTTAMEPELMQIDTTKVH